MKILIACEFSGIVREAFRKRGFDAWSCDIRPAEDNSPYHIQGNVLDILNDGWKLMIAHPPCTYLANSGVRWLWEDSRYLLATIRWKHLYKAVEFFKELFLCSHIPYIAVENPIPHRYAIAMIGFKYDQVIQPYQFGEPYSKATCLWLRNLPKLRPTKQIPKSLVKQTVWKELPSPERWKNRSRTYKGIAEAMGRRRTKEAVLTEGERERITNRHIAKLLSRLEPLNLPEIARDEIKREVWRLSDDLKELYEEGQKRRRENV